MYKAILSKVMFSKTIFGVFAFEKAVYEVDRDLRRRIAVHVVFSSVVRIEIVGISYDALRSR